MFQLLFFASKLENIPCEHPADLADAGDLGHFSKTSPWEPSVHVPLLVTGPSLPQNVVVDHPVSLIDVPWLWHLSLGSFNFPVSTELRMIENEKMR